MRDANKKGTRNRITDGRKYKSRDRDKDRYMVVRKIDNIQADPEMHGKILITSFM
jgi:hypothetical protein